MNFRADWGLQPRSWQTTFVSFLAGSGIREWIDITVFRSDNSAFLCRVKGTLDYEPVHRHPV